jgi:hypothetical protein
MPQKHRGPLKSGTPRGVTQTAPLVDITPKRFLCSVSMACPAVLEAAEDNSFVIIGQVCDPAVDGLSGRVGKSEQAVKISAELLISALRPYLSK